MAWAAPQARPVSVAATAMVTLNAIVYSISTHFASTSITVGDRTGPPDRNTTVGALATCSMSACVTGTAVRVASVAWG